MKTIAISEIKKLNAENGGNWFSPDTMRFFGSRLPVSAYVAQSGKFAFFVSSELSFDRRRRYTVRRANLQTGAVDTHGEFCNIGVREYAVNVAKTEAYDA